MRREAHGQGETRRINIKEDCDIIRRRTKVSTNDKRRSVIIVERKDTTPEIAGIRKVLLLRSILIVIS